jgi:hypothetical protein
MYVKYQSYTQLIFKKQKQKLNEDIFDWIVERV